VATPETLSTAVPALTENEQLGRINADYTERYGFHDAENYLYKAPKGLTAELVAKISEFKSEPQWMLDFRLKAFAHFLARPMPTWGSPMLAEVDFDDIHYFVRASERSERSWDDVPEDVKRTFDRLGIPEAERKFLSGVGAQYESEVVYHQVHEDLEKQGVIFTDMDTALREHEDLLREYFATIIPANDNKLAFGWSKGGDASGLTLGITDWCNFHIDTLALLHDYPKLGHDANFILIGANVFTNPFTNPAFITSSIWAIPKPPAGDTSCTAPTATEFGTAVKPLKHPSADAFRLVFTPVPSNTADAAATGYISAIDAEYIGQASSMIGAGRDTKEDSIDPAVGVILEVKVGQKVDAGGVLCRLYYTREDNVDEAAQLVEDAFRIASTAPESRELILEVVG